MKLGNLKIPPAVKIIKPGPGRAVLEVTGIVCGL